jgi:membrane-associated phospholipid phosphatase
LPLAIALWIWAPLVSLARVAMGVHYVSDIIAGALVGMLVVVLVWPISPYIFNLINGWVVSLLGLPLW